MPRLSKIRLTRETLSNLTPGSEQADAGQPGLTARCLASGAIAFTFRYRVNGKQARVTLGTYSDAFPVEAARKAARALLADVDQGSDPAAESKAQKSAPTFADAARLYLEGHVAKHCKPGSRKVIETHLRLHILPRIGGMDLTSIRRVDVEKMHSEIGATAGKPTANRALVTCKAIINYADKLEVYQGRNPAKGVRKYPEAKRERYLSADERARLWSALDAAEAGRGFGKGKIHAAKIHAIRLLVMIPARRSEIIGAEWSMVAWEQGAIVLDRDHSKVGGHRVPLSSLALEYLRGLYDARDPSCPYVVATDAGRPVDMANLNRAWISIRKDAGLADVHLHDLRHAFASDALNAGVPLEVIAEMLGHRSIRTTQRYAHLSRSTLADAMERTAAVIDARSKPAADNVIDMPKKRPA